MKDVHVKLKDGREFFGPLWEIRSEEGWFSLTIDPQTYPEAPDRFLFEDCASAINFGVHTAYNKVEDVDLLAWAENDRVVRQALRETKA